MVSSQRRKKKNELNKKLSLKGATLDLPKNHFGNQTCDYLWLENGMGIEGRKQSKGEKEKLVERERSSVWQLSHSFFREWQVLDGAAINKDEAKAVKFLETREPHSFKKSCFKKV